MGSGYWLQRNVSCCLPAEGRQYPWRKSWGDIWKFSRWALNEDRSGFWGPNHSCGKNVRLKIELLLVFPGATPLGKLIKPFCAYVVPRMKWELYLLICKHISYLHTFAVIAVLSVCSLSSFFHHQHFSYPWARKCCSFINLSPVSQEEVIFLPLFIAVLSICICYRSYLSISLLLISWRYIYLLH